MDFADALASADVLVRQKLGGDVTYTPGEGEAVTVSGIFTAPHTNVDLGEQGGGINTVAPTLFLTLEDLPSNPRTDAEARVTVSGVDYRWDTNSAEPDGMGGILLRLHRDD